MFQHLNLISYLDFQSVIQLSAASSQCNKMVNSHLSHTTKALFWGTATPGDTIWRIYKPTKFRWSPYLTKECREQLSYINISSFPKETESVYCGMEMVHHLTTLPNLTHLGVEYIPGLNNTTQYYSSIIDNLPQTITHATLRMKLRIDWLPSSITHLQVGLFFNESVDNLPPNLTHFYTGFYFCMPVDHLPLKLTHLSLGKQY